MFSKKATKIDEIFTVDLTLCSNCQMYSEDFVNFCGLRRRHELYHVDVIYVIKFSSLVETFNHHQKSYHLLQGHQNLFQSKITPTTYYYLQLTPQIQYILKAIRKSFSFNEFLLHLKAIKCLETFCRRYIIKR